MLRSRSSTGGRARGRCSCLGAFAWPLVCYLGFTLGVPLANGAHSRDGYWTHVAVVLTVVAVLMVVWWFVRTVWSRLSHQNRT